MPAATKIAPEMLAKLRDEQSAIEEIRRFYPHVPQKSLARMIRDHNFPALDQDTYLLDLLKRVGYRPLFSVYSVIRRYDRRITQTTANALGRASLLPPRSTFGVRAKRLIRIIGVLIDAILTAPEPW
jgi:hypothetical protein